MTFDDNALFRHPDIEQLRDETEENPAELRAAPGLSYISLTGTIGCLVNGAGLAMSTMDIIKYHGGEPANFLDVGGGANKDQVTEALPHPPRRSQRQGRAGQHLRRHHEVRHHRRRHHRRLPGSPAQVPFVVRLEGTNVAEGKEIIATSNLNVTSADDLDDAAQKIVAQVKKAR